MNPSIYSSVDFLKRTISNNIVEVNRAKSMLKNAEDVLEEVSNKLLNQFSGFVSKNRGLYDDDFIDMLEVGVSIINIDIQNTKCAIRIKVESTRHGVSYVMIPFLFITSPADYLLARKMQKEFGKDATQKTVEKHYDSEISKLLAEVDTLKKKKSMVKSNLWK